MVVHLSKHYGFQLQRGMGGDRKMYLYGVIWFRRRNGYLGYWYPSMRWL